MKYIFITAVAISINVIIVFMLGNKVFGVSLRLKSLMMCGLFAFLLSLLLPRALVGFTSLADISGWFTIFSIILAGFVVCYDDMKEFSSGTAVEIELDSLSEIEDFRQDVFEDRGSKTGIDIMLVDLITENVESTRPSLINSSIGQVAEIETSTTSETSESQFNSDLLLESISSNSLYEESSVVRVVTENVETIILAEQIDDTLEEIPVDKEDLMLIAKPEVMLYNKVLVPDDCQATHLMESTKERPELGLASGSLDELLESAFSYKERGEDSYALDTFKYALKFHRDKKIAPFLVIEIANLLKTKGAYNEAITLLTESRNLPGLIENHGLDQDFINTIAYLRIIKNNLLENHFDFIPISKIPVEILKKIDDEFRQWRKFL